MYKPFTLFLLGTLCFLSSCNIIQEKDKSAEVEISKSQFLNPQLNQTFTTDREAVTKDFATWYNYTYSNVVLSEDFIGLDTNLDTISKKTFLDRLVNGNVVALKTEIVNGQSVYQLFKLNSKDESIQGTMKQMASTEMEHFEMEGSNIPDFNFTDLNGKVYDKSSTEGKIIVLKCWFINCVACVKEFPQLNKLVDENQNRNDLIFLSLAIDAKKDLHKFLKHKEFKYAVIPETENYMTNKLNIKEYPTHLLIDKNGKILKVVNRIEELTQLLTKQLELNTLK